MAVANDTVPDEAKGFYPHINPYYNIQTYSDFAVWLKSKVTETIQYHECNWRKIDEVGYPTFACNAPSYPNIIGTSGNTSGVVSGGPGAYAHDCGTDNIDALNMQCAMGKTLIMMYLVSVAEGNPNFDYLCHITDIAYILRGQLQINSQDNTSYTWCHTYNCSCIEDIAHAQLIMSFADLCHQYNQYIYDVYSNNSSLKLFYSTDMQKFANTFIKHIYQSPGNFANNTFGLSGNTNTCNPTDIDNIGAYTFLTKYNPYVYHIVAERFQGRAIYNMGGDLLAYAQLALYQKAISNNSAFNNPNLQYFNPVAVQINHWPNTNITFPNNIHWSSSASGDFDGDGINELAVIDANNGKLSVFSIDNTTHFLQQVASVSNNSLPWKYMAATDADGLPGDEMIITTANDITVYKITNNNLNPVTTLNLSDIVGISAGNIDQTPDNEILTADINGNVFMIKYNGLVWNYTYIGNIGGWGLTKSISIGEYDGVISNGNEIAFAFNNIIVIYKRTNNGITYFTHFFDYTNTNISWKTAAMCSADFDNDNTDEIVVFNEYHFNNVEGPSFYILKYKNGGLQNVAKEYFPYNQFISTICSLNHPAFGGNIVLAVFQDIGEITLFTLDGMCSNLILNNLNITHATAIDNLHTGVNNNYILDYHSENTLTASNFVIQDNSKVNFIAGNKIILSDGFKAKSGTYFRAYIDPAYSCSTPAFRQAGYSTRHNTNTTLVHQSDLKKEFNPLNENNNKYLSFKVFPNPAHTSISIQSPPNISNIIIKDISGKIILENKISSQPSATLDISHLSNGLYFIQVQTASGTFTEKVIVQH